MSNLIKDKRSGISSVVRRIFGPGLAGYLPVCARLRRCLETPSFRLRVYGPQDLSTLQDLFGPEMLPKPFHSSLSFRRWLISTFQVLYMLETREVGGMTLVVGFIGLYRVDPGRSVWLSTGIFDAEDRGKGYGSKGLEILLDHLQENTIAKKVYVEVMKTNERSLAFFERSGFTTRLENEGSFVLEKDL
jgi:RimJ/RimL family protein N-acetyltransferase